MIRKAVVAGSFYPGTREGIINFIKSNITIKSEKYNAISIMVPHAGYIFSGKTAISVYSSINILDKVIIIGPNHTGLGAPLSIMTEGVWETPMGKVQIDSELAEKILTNSRYLKTDILAHSNEHSIEVQIPMLNYFKSDFKFVPIVMGNYSTQFISDLSNAIIKSSDENVLVIASSDMSHYISRREAKELDSLAFEKIKNLDSSGLMDTVYEYDISMCGSGPMAVAINYAKERGAKEAILLDYTDSGEVTNDTSSVVSYAGFVII
jgi:AmmeMemoRadiSam system protein B